MPLYPRRPEEIDPEFVLRTDFALTRQDGSRTVNLVVPDVPVEEVASLGKLLALAIGNHMGLAEDVAGKFADRIVASLQRETDDSFRSDE